MAAMFPTERSGLFNFGMDTAVDKAAARRQPATAAPEGAAAAVLSDPMYKQFVGEPRAKLEKAQKEYGVFEGEMTADQATREARKLGRRQEAFGSYEQAVRAPELRAERTALEERAGEAFVPTQENVQDMATIFSLIGVLGFAIGAGGKNNAIQAMNAMNGMMEGYKQGRQDRYQREKDSFESNARAIKTKIDALNSRMTDIAKLAAVDMEKANMEADMLFAQEGADFLKQYKDKVGLVNTIKMLQEQVKGGEKLYEFIEKERIRSDEKQKERQLRIDLQEDRQRDARDLKRFVAGLKGDESTKRGMVQLFMAQRAVNALGGVTSAVESINLLPAGTTAGILPNLTTKDGMFNAVRNFAGRKMSSQEAKAVETLFTGVTRNLASIEASGAATGLVGLATQLEKLRPVAGDTTVDVALKMADIRRVAVENIIPLIESGLMPKQQASVADGLVKRMEKAIPYTTSDVINATMRKPGKETISQAGERITSGVTGFTEEDQRRLDELERKSRGAQ
jgi:hypothetical protein